MYLYTYLPTYGYGTLHTLYKADLFGGIAAPRARSVLFAFFFLSAFRFSLDLIDKMTK